MFDKQVIQMIAEGIRDTLYMTLFSTIIGYVIGLPFGVLLHVTSEKGLHPNRIIYRIGDFICNIIRSIPFLILLILLIPFTRLIVGKSYGSTATIVPLVICAAPYIARVVESSLNEVDAGVIEAAKAMGASKYADYFQGTSCGGQNFTDQRSNHHNRTAPWIFSNVRNRRWRRTWRYCSTIWLLSLADRYHDCYGRAADCYFPDYPESRNKVVRSIRS